MRAMAAEAEAAREARAKVEMLLVMIDGEGDIMDIMGILSSG